MPIYEYECSACGHRLEKLQKLNADPLSQCPVCSRQSLSRLVSMPGFRLAGSGWYETDFKTGHKKNLAADASCGAKATTTEGSAATASKAETPSSKGDAA